MWGTSPKKKTTDVAGARVAVLVSGRGSNLRALLGAARTWQGHIAVVISNVADAPALEIARAAGVETRVVAAIKGQPRADYDARLDAELRGLSIDWIVLAGFMRILSDGFVAAWPERIVNIHPSLLPAFAGLDPHQRAIDAGVRFAGCTVHLVEPGAVDGGRILDQRVVPVYPGDTAEHLAARVLVEEHDLYPSVIRGLLARSPAHR